ncbi:nucleolar protein 58-like [Palaemon carinicauda]|uniref:nucleolar protein 58-like n=1 Tax=Palaemon carinicauda TaxID=392227 RepID=UPI0035B5E2C5
MCHEIVEMKEKLTEYELENVTKTTYASKLRSKNTLVIKSTEENMKASEIRKTIMKKITTDVEQAKTSKQGHLVVNFADKVVLEKAKNDSEEVKKDIKVEVDKKDLLKPKIKEEMNNRELTVKERNRRKLSNKKRNNKKLSTREKRKRELSETERKNSNLTKEHSSNEEFSEEDERLDSKDIYEVPVHNYYSVLSGKEDMDRSPLEKSSQNSERKKESGINGLVNSSSSKKILKIPAVTEAASSSSSSSSSSGAVTLLSSTGAAAPLTNVVLGKLE